MFAEKSAPPPNAELDELCVNTLRFLSVDAIQKANSGHPGLPLGAAPMAYVLWTQFLKHNPANPDWFDRDRFVLSAGHGSALLYSLLHMTGYALPLEQLKQFRQFGSMTPGHPDRGTTPGVEITTGPLGQGFANGVGMAIAEANLAARFNRDQLNIIDHHTYGLVSDGDLMEGISSEAASLAGHLQLGKLIYMYDHNRITLSASTDMTFTEDCTKRFDAYGWHTQTVEDGNDLRAIESALFRAHEETARPSLIIVHTHIGYGSPHKQDSFEAHGSPLGVEEVRLTKIDLNWPVEPNFYIPAQCAEHFSLALKNGQRVETQWHEKFADYHRAFPDLALELQDMITGAALTEWSLTLPEFPADTKGLSTRVVSGKALNLIAAQLPDIVGGSADLDPSTFTALTNLGDFQPADLTNPDQQGSDGGGWTYSGRNLHFGIREHAMGGICNGVAAHGGLIPYCSTFLVFSDYMRPPMRLAAMMGLRVIYIFTHDSIAVGEDGATHQPVEQLASLRAIPNLVVIRPGDANETSQAWKVVLHSTAQPFALILTRQSVPTLDRSQFAPAEGIAQGAYILADTADGQPDLILIASGSELHLIVEAAAILSKQGLRIRLVSMPSWELFDQQPEEYRRHVFPLAVPARLAVEAGVAQGWHRYVGDKGDIISVERFGASAPGEVMLEKYGFTVENVCIRALMLLRVKPANTRDRRQLARV
jgi:transketolase